MGILLKHIPFYRDLFAIPDLFRSPLLMIGYQDIYDWKKVPKDFRFKDVKTLLKHRGIKDIESVDLFDPRADYRWDLNYPVEQRFTRKYATIFDIGSIEHIFDTAQVLKNYFALVADGGTIFIHTHVNGYFKHGYHVFNPEIFIDTFNQNQAEILTCRYSTIDGEEVSDPSVRQDIIIWIAARVHKHPKKFIVPQQSMWPELYRQQRHPIISKLKKLLTP